MFINRTYKFKLYVNQTQQQTLKQVIGSNRFIYNLFLHFNTEQYKKYKKIVNISDMLLMLEKAKEKYPFLNKTPQHILKATLVTLKNELDTAIKRNNAFPHFRTKDKQEQFSCIEQFQLLQQTNEISIEGICHLKYINSRQIPGNIRTVSIIKKQNQWFLSVLISQQVKEKSNNQTKIIGIDVGLKEFAILSNGKSIENPRFYQNLETKLKAEQQKLNRRKKGSKNWEKQLKKVNNVYESIYYARLNFLHQLSSFLVSHYDVIGIEKLSIKEMASNKKLAKSIHDASWGTFINMLKYKAKEQSKLIVEVGRFYPSSQLCSSCGKKQLMPLHLRTYSCKNCHQEIDRDYNAAKNIEKRAKELLIKK